MGKMTPPMGAPQAARLRANARFLEKYVDTSATHGVKRSPFPKPWTIPWDNTSCQYLETAEVVKTPTNWIPHPTTRSKRKWPRSMIGPENAPRKKRRKRDIEPTQEMADPDLPRYVIQWDSKSPKEEK